MDEQRGSRKPPAGSASTCVGFRCRCAHHFGDTTPSMTRARRGALKDGSAVSLSPRASTAKWFSSARPSMPRPEGRSVMLANSTAPGIGSWSRIRKNAAWPMPTSAALPGRHRKLGDVSGTRGRSATPGNRPQPYGDPSAARGAARGARHACAAEGLARRAGPAAIRLLALPGRDAAGAARRSSGL